MLARDTLHLEKKYFWTPYFSKILGSKVCRLCSGLVLNPDCRSTSQSGNPTVQLTYGEVLTKENSDLVCHSLSFFLDNSGVRASKATGPKESQLINFPATYNMQRHI